jgi:hypothetical protein
MKNFIFKVPAGDIAASIVVFELPPRESFSNHVSAEFLYEVKYPLKKNVYIFIYHANVNQYLLFRYFYVITYM